MQKFGVITVSLFLVLVYHMNSGEGLKCYVCRSDTDVNCTSKNMSPNYSLECPVTNGRAAVICRKISQKLRFKNEDKYTSIRECGYEKGHLQCYFFKYIKFAYQETCECTRDNCNRGSSCEPDRLVIVTFFFLVTASFFYKLY